MADNAKIRTLFGALVVGGSVVLQGCAAKDPAAVADGVSETEKPVAEPDVKPADTKAPPPDDYCQVELVFHEYTREGDDRPQPTCLDKKSKEEIIELIEKAQAKACMSPFCGCWLG